MKCTVERYILIAMQIHPRNGDVPMKLMTVLLCLVAALLVLALLIAYICFRIVFYASRRKENHEEIRIPEGEIYQPYKDIMVDWIKRMRAMPQEDFAITSFDGLTLRGKYFEYEPGAPIELMFHGYRGTAERDMCGGIFRCFSIGRSALLVDQRGSGYSDGHVVSFGINESRDCLRWVDFLVGHFGPDVKMILTGLSMGAATVLTAAGQPLPENVVGVLADCGFTSAREIIYEVMKKLHLPPKVLYPFVRLGAWLYGGFDLEERSPIAAMEHCRVPVIFYHGDDDQYVPLWMSMKNYEACKSPKKLVITPGAGHGLCFVRDQEGYLRELKAFCQEQGMAFMDNGTSML